MFLFEKKVYQFLFISNKIPEVMNTEITPVPASLKSLASWGFEWVLKKLCCGYQVVDLSKNRKILTFLDTR